MQANISPSGEAVSGAAGFSHYKPAPEGYDEAFGTGGQLRPHWQVFAHSIGGLSPAEQLERYERLQRLVVENGVAHDLFAEQGKQQPWAIDLIPLILSSSEWTYLERGLIQRAHLFDLIAKDIYGPQNLLKSGRIPPRLVFSDPAFLRACRNAKNQPHLIGFFAADLIRDANGAWRIIDVHAETPAGVGFALANRLVHGQIAGDLFRKTNAVRLAPHFQQLQTDFLQRIERDDPLVVLLTPGPRHEDYFGHAYLRAISASSLWKAAI